MDKKQTTEYIKLMVQAEQATSHKEARHLINQSTELMNSSKTVKPCRYPNSELQASIQRHQEKIKRYQKYIRVSEALIDMCQDIIDSRPEVKED
jgi:predicted RNase H-like nuclease (RuvC/YqgF family)